MTVTYSRGRGVGGVSGVLCGVSGVVVCLPCWWCVWRAVLAKRRRAVLCAPLGGPGEYLTLGRGEFTLWLFVGLSVYPPRLGSGEGRDPSHSLRCQIIGMSFLQLCWNITPTCG